MSEEDRKKRSAGKGKKEMIRMRKREESGRMEKTRRLQMERR